MDEWGSEGPTLLCVDTIHQRYSGMTTVHFLSTEDTEAARIKTGWPIWDKTSLEILRHEDLIETREPGEPPQFYGDLFLRN
jgi:hypothetical protein